MLDQQGRVYPFARPLGIRYDVRKPGRKVSPQELGARIGREPLPVALVAVSQFRKGAHWKPRRLTEGRGVRALLEHAVPARMQPSETLKAVSELARRAPVVAGDRGEATETAASILRSVDRFLKQRDGA